MLTDYKVFTSIVKDNKIVSTEKDYLSNKGVDYEEVIKVGLPTKLDYMTVFVFNVDGSFIEVIEERVKTEEISFIELLDSADIEYTKSDGTIDMDGEISNTDDIGITVNGVGLKFLFGSSSQSLLGVVSEHKCRCHK